MTGLHKLPPHLAKPFIYTIRDRAFDFWGVGGGGEGGRGLFFFPQDFLPIENQRIFVFHSLKPTYFFQDKAKSKYFFLNSIYARNVFFQIYTFAYFLNPTYMGILFICSFWVRGCRYILKLFLISAI